MKTPVHSPFAKLALGGVLALSPLCLQAATTADIDLSGVVLKSGLTVSRSSVATVEAASAYDYLFTGTVTGKGSASFVVGENTPIAEALTDLGFFTGSEDGTIKITVFNPSGAQPFKVFNRTGKVSGSSGGFTVRASATAKVAISSAGIAKLKLINPKLKVTTPFGPAKASVVFDDGALCTVSVTPPTSDSAKPDAMILLGDNSGLGNNIYNTTGADQSEGLNQKPGKSKTYRVGIQNDGAASGAYTVTAAITGDTDAFTVTYKDVDGTTFDGIDGAGSPLSLDASAFALINVKVKAAAKAAKDSTATITITTTGASGTDVVILQPKVN